MIKKGNLFMVGVLLANIFIQPLFSLQSVFAEGEEVAIESHQEVYEDVELVTEESGDLNIVPPSEQENLVEEVVTEEEINSEYDEISDDDNSNLEENLEFDETEVESVEENASSNVVVSFIQQTYESEAVGYTSSLKFNIANIGNAAAENVVVRVQLPVNYIEEYSNISDYFYNQGLTNLSQHYDDNNLYVNYNIGDLPTGYNKDFSFEFKTITEIQEENITVPVTAQVLENGNTVDQIGPVVYNFVNPNIIYPEEDDEDSDSMKVMAIGATSDAFYALEPEYNEGTGEFALRFQYDLTKLSGGEEFTIEIDPNFVELNELQDNVSYTVEKEGNVYKIKFKDSLSGNNQGIISIRSNVKQVEESKEYTISWKLDGVTTETSIFIRKPGDSESDIKEEKSSKNVQSYIWDLGNKIKGEVNEDGEQFITVEDDITSVNIPYTLVYQTTTGGILNIKDELDDLLTYNEGSFTATLESWDSNGWNKENTTVDLTDYLTINGNTFSIEGYELPPNSRITINYNANVNDAKALETHLNQLLENEQLDGEEGSVSYVFNNKAKINDEDRDGKYSGNVNVPGEKPEVIPEYPSNVLEKYVDPTTANATFDNEGNLIPIPVTYTLKLNMSKFKEENSNLNNSYLYNLSWFLE
ncbi:hypothetical protein ACEN33_12200 [Ruoffia sp. FAM 24228]|uniref:hypothetical protein n=1 Tax=Ruoffia sp. FAM 24228 TaxID=3259517 RepID=UPI003885F2C3